LNSITKSYSALGLQTYTHRNIDKYQCLGPYIPTWMVGAAPWHPSIIAHRFRGSQIVFFWLMAFREVLVLIENSIDFLNMDDIQVEKHIKQLLIGKIQYILNIVYELCI